MIQRSAFLFLTLVLVRAVQVSQSPPAQQTMMSFGSWGTGWYTSLYTPLNALMSNVFTALYGDAEATRLSSQLQRCESLRNNALLLDSVRFSMITFQITSICTSSNPTAREVSLFTQVLNLLTPLLAPCNLEENVLADLLIAQLLAAVPANNYTHSANATAALLSVSQQAFNRFNSVLGNLTNTLTNMANRGLLDQDEVPSLVGLLEDTSNTLGNLFGTVLIQAQTDPIGAVATAQQSMESIDSDTVARLQAAGVPQADIDQLSATLDTLTTELTDTMTQIAQGDQDLDDAELTLGSFTSDQSNLLREGIQITNDLISQNVDEFCASTRQASTS